MKLEILMALGGLLLLMCVFANRISSKLGIPSLLVFLAVGMIAGSDGAGIQFYSAELSNYIGSFALAVNQKRAGARHIVGYGRRRFDGVVYVHIVILFIGNAVFDCFAAQRDFIVYRCAGRV